MKLRLSVVFVAVHLILLTSIASAHYLWVTLDGKAGQHGTAHIYFEGGPGPGDGQYLDPFIERGTTWLRTIEASKPAEVKTTVSEKPGKRWLSTELSQPGPRSIDSFGKWGVYRYGETDVLLHYYARYLDVEDHDQLHELARAEQMALDIVPHDDGETLHLTVLWQGKPAAARPIAVRGPKGLKANLKTDKQGVATVKLGERGRYTFRTNVEEKQSGEDDGKKYDLKRHHATLLMNLPL